MITESSPVNFERNKAMRKLTPKAIVVLASMGLVCGSAAGQTIRYVDTSNTSGTSATRDGSSWANAYKYPQDALDEASSGYVIKVAQGVYHPDDEERGSEHTTADRNEAFELVDDVVIEGGYRGIAGLPNNANDRDFNLYETILSGDLSDNDPTTTDNSYDVVRGNGANALAILSGVTITAATEHGVENGAGTQANFEYVIVRECGSAGSNGGGMLNYGSISIRPTVSGCTFVGNIGDEGGAMANGNGAAPKCDVAEAQSGPPPIPAASNWPARE